MDKAMGLPVEMDEAAVVLALNTDTPEPTAAEASDETAASA